MNAVTVSGPNDGRIAIGFTPPGAAKLAILLELDAAGAEWLALQLIGGARKIGGGAASVTGAVWREMMGGAPTPIQPDGVRVVATEIGQLAIVRGGESIIGLFPPAAEAIALQLIDAARKAHGREPLAVSEYLGKARAGVS